jgi:hypothetical protein
MFTVRNEFIDNQQDRAALNNFTYSELSKTLKNLIA